MRERECVCVCVFVCAYLPQQLVEAPHGPDDAPLKDVRHLAHLGELPPVGPAVGHVHQGLLEGVHVLLLIEFQAALRGNLGVPRNFQEREREERERERRK